MTEILKPKNIFLNVDSENTSISNAKLKIEEKNTAIALPTATINATYSYMTRIWLKEITQRHLKDEKRKQNKTNKRRKRKKRSNKKTRDKVKKEKIKKREYCKVI